MLQGERLLAELREMAALEGAWYANVGSKTGKRCCVAMRDAADEIERLTANLTPTADTKREYMGEFTLEVDDVDEHGDPEPRTALVPWTTIKEIMHKIRER